MWENERAKARESSDRAMSRAMAMFGFHYETIAKRIYGGSNKRYIPSRTEVGRVGRYARSEGVSTLSWRRGESPQAQSYLADASKVSPSAKKVQRLRLAPASKRRAG